MLTLKAIKERVLFKDRKKTLTSEAPSLIKLFSGARLITSGTEEQTKPIKPRIQAIMRLCESPITDITNINIGTFCTHSKPCLICTSGKYF